MKGGLTWGEYWSLPTYVRPILIDAIQDEAEEHRLAMANAKVKRS